MAQVELIMPKMGESVAEATIIKWLKEEGESIELEESVLEIATDKVDSEVPSPTEGVLSKKLFAEDDVVKVGEAIAIIETDAAAPSDDTSQNGQTAVQEAPAPAAEPAVAEASSMVSAAVETAAGGDIPRSSNGRFYSPLVRSIAKEEGVSIQELDGINGSGCRRPGYQERYSLLHREQNGSSYSSCTGISTCCSTTTQSSSGSQRATGTTSIRGWR